MKNEVSRLRKERGISQDALATAMGVSRQTICSIENGKYNPSIILAIHIARYFGKTVEDIFIADDLTTWKTADMLRAENKYNKNYEDNKHIMLEPDVIIGQSNPPCDLFRYGKFPISFNGDEAIALYNLGILSKSPKRLRIFCMSLKKTIWLFSAALPAQTPKSSAVISSVTISPTK